MAATDEKSSKFGRKKSNNPACVQCLKIYLCAARGRLIAVALVNNPTLSICAIDRAALKSKWCVAASHFHKETSSIEVAHNRSRRSRVLQRPRILQGSELPEVKAIVILDAEGARVACKYYSRDDFPDKLAQADFERKVFKKTRNSQARLDPEVAILDGLTVVFKSGVDVTFAVVGGSDENELILVGLLDALFDTVGNLMKTQPDRRALHNNLELLLLTIDEMVDGGVILEVDPVLVESRVMLRGAVPDSISSYKELTVGAVLDKARDKVAKQFIK